MIFWRFYFFLSWLGSFLIHLLFTLAPGLFLQFATSFAIYILKLRLRAISPFCGLLALWLKELARVFARFFLGLSVDKAGLALLVRLKTAKTRGLVSN